MHILIIEDDLALGNAIVNALRQSGSTAIWVRTLQQARSALQEAPDAAILDLNLPDGDGLALLREWRREESKLPVIITSARGLLDERLRGLDSGADDYLVKPFAVAELLSRLRALERRSANQGSTDWRIGPLRLSPHTQEVWLHEQIIALSPREFALLTELARTPCAVVAKSRLAQRLSPLGEPLDTTTIEVHLSNLRRKLGADCITTVRGVGYRLNL